MARLFDGTSAYIANASVPIVGYPLTLAAWFYPTVAAQNADLVGACIWPADGVNNSDIRLRYNVNTGPYSVQADVRTSGSDAIASTSTFASSINVWYHACGVFLGTGANQLIAYLNGGGKASGNGNASGTLFHAGATIGALNLAGTQYNFFAGRIADAAIWNVQLTDAEIAALAQGARPSKIRPKSLLWFVPNDGLQSPEPDLSGLANNGTVTAATQATGPPIAMLTPRWPQFTFLTPPPPPPISDIIFGDTIVRPQWRPAWY